MLCELVVMKTESQLNWNGHTVSAGPPTTLNQIYSTLKIKLESAQRVHTSTNTAEISNFVSYKDKKLDK